MRPFSLIILLLLSACAAPPRLTAGDAAMLAVTIELDSDGSARITERLKVTAKNADAARLSRNIHVQPISFLARQEVHDATLTTASGSTIPLRRRAYGEWVNLDFGPIGTSSELTLAYTVSPFFPDRERFHWVAVGLFWNLPLSQISVELIDGGRAGFSDLSARLDYQPCETCRFETTPDGFTMTAGAPIERGQVLELTGRRRQAAPAFDALGPTVSQNWPFLLWLGLMLAGSLIALFLGAPGRNRAIRALNWALLIPISLALFHSTRYWLHEYPLRLGELDSMIGEFLWNPAVLALVAAFIGWQNRKLARWEKSSWHLQHGVFLVSLAVLPLPYSGVWFVPIGALLPLMFWSRKSTASWFGAGLFEIAEHVRSIGETTLSEAARFARIPASHLAFLLGRERYAALVFDPKSEKLMSAENARLLENIRVCPHCGGADLVTRGAGHAACGFCGREYVSSFELASAVRPVPVLVEALASFFFFLGGVLGSLGLLLGVVFFVIGLTGGDSLTESALIALFAMVVPALVAWRAMVFARTLRDGGGFGRLKFWLLLGTPAFLPLLVFSRLFSRRILLHFGRLELRDLEAELKRGPMDLPALARWLKTDASEAADAAAYLCGNHLIDAIYDRRLARIAHLDLYRQLSREEVCCLRCGGTLGLAAGHVACQYCGAEPEAGLQ